MDTSYYFYTPGLRWRATFTTAVQVPKRLG